jgi:hypothetical protein
LTGELHLIVPPAVFEEIVTAVTERVRVELTETSPWLTRAEAADYLRVPRSRLEKDKTVPSHRWDGRVMYHRAEVDAWLAAQ